MLVKVLGMSPAGAGILVQGTASLQAASGLSRSPGTVPMLPPRRMVKHMHGFHQLRGPMAAPSTSTAKALLMHAFAFTC